MESDDVARLRAWLTLLRAPAIGLAGRAALLERFGDAPAVVSARAADLRACGLGDESVRALRHPDEDRLRADLVVLDRPQRRLITIVDDHYPALLATIADPPTALFVDGDPAALSLPQLAIVGSRNPTPTGAETATAFAAHLAARGLSIASGLALGIDAAAHRGAIEAGGSTVAVLGTGIDITYPRGNAALRDAFGKHGTIVTEFPPGTPPRKENFPSRNRIISGLSTGVLVVEAALRSGSLITARLAAEQGREVFAIPGSIHNPLARGCHRLLREGARLVESADDIVAELGALFGSLRDPGGDAPADDEPTGDATPADPEYDRLLAAIGHEATTVDTLVTRTGLTANVVSSMLLILEMRGRIRLGAGGYVRAGQG